MSRKISARTAHYVAAGLAVVVFAVAGWTAVWMFRIRGPASGPIWNIILKDRATLGFVRAALVMLAVYTIGSLAALLAGGRWIRSVGKSGLEIDAAEPAYERIADLKERLRRADKDRDELVRLLEVSLHG